MDYIRKTYGVPAKRGGRVRFGVWREGVITGAYGHYLRVRFDGHKHSTYLHPTFEVTYL